MHDTRNIVYHRTIAPHGVFYYASARIVLGQGHFIEPYCLLGELPKDLYGIELRTVIGRGCHLRSHTIIYAGNMIGDHFQTGHGVLVREHCQIGDNVSVGSCTVIEHHVMIASNVRIHSQAFIPEFTVIRENAWIGPNVVMTNAAYPKGREVKTRLKGPEVKEHAIIGANATILPGVILGRHCLVGAGSVVTRDVEDGWVVAGNPAKFIKKKSALRYRDSNELVYDESM